MNKTNSWVWNPTNPWARPKDWSQNSTKLRTFTRAEQSCNNFPWENFYLAEQSYNTSLNLEHLYL